MTTSKIAARAMNWTEWVEYQDYVDAQQTLLEEKKIRARKMTCNLQEWVIKNIYGIDLKDDKQAIKPSLITALTDKTMELTLKGEEEEVKN